MVLKDEKSLPLSISFNGTTPSSPKQHCCRNVSWQATTMRQTIWHLRRLTLLSSWTGVEMLVDRVNWNLTVIGRRGEEVRGAQAMAQIDSGRTRRARSFGSIVHKYRLTNAFLLDGTRYTFFRTTGTVFSARMSALDDWWYEVTDICQLAWQATTTQIVETSIAQFAA